MNDELRDRQVRIRAFEFLAQQTQLLGDVLPWSVLSRGFEFEGQRVPLIGPQGIFKPAVLTEIPLSIATAPVVEGRPRQYEDGLDDAGHLLYRYRGTDPRHRDNVGLRRAMEERVPLVYLFGVVKGASPRGPSTSSAMTLRRSASASRSTTRTASACPVVLRRRSPRPAGPT